jgi:predicted deacylase
MLRSLCIGVATFTSIFPIFAVGQEKSSFSVGTATAEAGQKVTGTIDVPAGSDAATQIPVVVIRGSNPGPTLALVSGAHGTEYASIIALEGLIGSLDATQISGTVIILPLVNIASFEQKVPHVNPIDNKSMNRFYPGNEDGTQTERASFLITKEVVDQSDFLIDFHGGDLDESLRPYAYWVVTGDKKEDAASKEMVLAFGLDHIIISSDRPKDRAATRYLDNTAAMRGKPTITVEAGYAGTVETDDVAALVQGTRSVMRLLKMLPGTAHGIDHPVWIKTLGEVTSPVDGIFYPLVKRDTFVEAGRKLGDVTDYFGKVIFEARAPVSGIILHICAVPSMKKGDNIANIGVIAPKAP